MPGKSSIAIITIALTCAMLLGSCQPMRNDFTTTPGDPPQFEAIASLPENRGRDLRYPYSRNEAPAITPLPVPGLEPDAAEVLAKVEQVADAMADWDIVAVNRSRLKLEAVATTPLFKFKDDVVVEIRQRVASDGTVTDPEDRQAMEATPNPVVSVLLEVHMRSKSRVGGFDFGANKKRVALFLDKLKSAFED